MKEFEKTIKKYNISGQVFLLGKGKREFILENNGLVELVYIFRILKAATDYTPEEIYKIINKEFEVFEETIDHLVSAYARINIVSYDSKEDFWYDLNEYNNKATWTKIPNSDNKFDKLSLFQVAFDASEASNKYCLLRKSREKNTPERVFKSFCDCISDI